MMNEVHYRSLPQRKSHLIWVGYSVAMEVDFHPHRVQVVVQTNQQNRNPVVVVECSGDLSNLIGHNFPSADDQENPFDFPPVLEIEKPHPNFGVVVEQLLSFAIIVVELQFHLLFH